MKLCRFRTNDSEVRIGLVADDATVIDLTPVGITRLQPVLDSDDPEAQF